MRRGFLRVAFLLLMTSLVSGQEEQEPYFSLSSGKTFGPGEKPTVELTAVDIAQLDFRVYRVNDPVKFFGQLEDPHMFGGHAPRPARDLTLIERFHRMKRNWHSQMRFAVRDQFSDDSWKSLTRMRAKPADDRLRGVTNYADAPLLNSQQVAAVWRQNIASKGRWNSQSIPVEVTQKGVYLVEAARGELRAYTILMISDLGMITKTARGHLLAYVANRVTGAPVAGASVMLRYPKQAPVSYQTDQSGLVDMKSIPAGDGEPLLLARSEDGFAANSLSGSYLRRDSDDDYAGYVYTDRPVYRPGHQVSFKGILRAREGNAFKMPAVRSVDTEIQGPDDKTIFHKTLSVTATGGVSGALTVPADAGLGYYMIRMRAGESSIQAGFQVEEYKKPEYEVRVTLAKPRVLQGESIQATFEARYYFGEPVANAKVKYVVHRSRYWYPLYAVEEDLENNADGDDTSGSEDEQILDEEGTLDANGKLTVPIPTELNEHHFDARYRIEARVTDAGNREISGASAAIATFGSFMVNIEPEQYVLTPGQRGTFKVEARDYDGKPIATSASVDLIEWIWNGKKEQERSLYHADTRTDEQGQAKVAITIPRGGSFRARVSAKTPEGRTVLSYAYVWVSSQDMSLWGDQPKTVQIVPDKKTYQAGDVARVLIVTGVPQARILFAEEGRTLENARVIEANGPTITVEVPVRAEQVPNFFVTAAFLKDNQFYQGSKTIKVPPAARALKVEIKSSKPQYRPGEPAQYAISAHDAAGKPVVAEFSFGVVDEAIYGIRKDSTPDILQFFYGRAYNMVGTESSLTYYFQGEAGKRRMQLAQMRNHRALAQIKPEHLVQPKVRKAFPDTALWIPTLMTDASGQALANLTFPDSVTTWRATARGATADTKVGSAIEKTIVRKNVILRLVTPRFFTQGDEVTISAVLHNYLPLEKQARVSLEAKGLDAVDGASRDVTIPSRGEVKVDWRVRATAVGEAVITGKGLTDEESDAVELTLPVNPQGVKLVEARAGSLSGGNATTDFTLSFSPQSVPESRFIEIGVSPSIAGALFGAIEYLTEFPYGCTEQTMSSFLPNVVVSRALKDLGVKSDVNPALLAKKLRAGMDRLYDFQHEDGGWGWWKTDESALFMTAYVVAGLSQAKAAGQDVEVERIDRAAKWLRAAYDKEPRMTADLKGYSAYALALAGKSDPKLLDDAWQRKDKMSPYGLALLGLAFESAKDQRVGEVAGRLEASAKSSDAEAWWPSDRDDLMDIYSDATPESTAYALKLLVHQKPQSALLEKAAVWLMNHRREGAYWYSTKQTAMVIYGLTDYLKATGELKPNFSAAVSLNGKQILAHTFQPADALAPASPRIRVAASDANAIHIERTGEGRLYWSARQDYFSTEQKFVKAGSYQLNLLRDYFKLTAAKDGEKIVYKLEPLQGALAVGDVLAVRLTVTGGEWRYLLMEDPIPSGAEFIERDDLYEIREKPSWWQSYFTRREFHDDHAAIFQTYFSSGQQQYFYLLKIVNPGQFRVSPAKVQPMYQPNYMSTSESRLVEVR